MKPVEYNSIEYRRLYRVPYKNGDITCEYITTVNDHYIEIIINADGLNESVINLSIDGDSKNKVIKKMNKLLKIFDKKLEVEKLFKL